ncbi:response regulator MprA [bacterium BMS3Abin02]|nr:response regulator MprA [bacterium BMS3Abin02]GBE20736.1 response regulator MprA [bacterium BMS3Bbin01]HDH24901.1 response regulator transcription factor [Actinomycetota bacterium]HDK45979.1 response regulator transcription factor [Actinomycetota bacterium]HDL50225.1 response regulator transcription factor [Actinomycetota bacterium]
MSGSRILIAEDDRGVRQSLERALRFEGYDVSAVKDGAEALEVLIQDVPELLLLDVMMPHIDGLTVCRRLRATGNDVPVLMLTARHEVRDRVAGLDAGADDYLVKPFALEELLARIRALLRRNVPSEGAETLAVGDLTLDPRTRTVMRGDRELNLTKTEFDLLELLLVNAGVVLTREVIYERIWGYDFGTSSNSLDVYIGYLRRKMEEGDEPRLISTVRGVGYVIRKP